MIQGELIGLEWHFYGYVGLLARDAVARCRVPGLHRLGTSDLAG